MNSPGWFAAGMCTALLGQWLWMRWIGRCRIKARARGSSTMPPPGDWMDAAFPLPPPDVMEVIQRQLDRDIAAGVARRAQDRDDSPG